MSLLNTWFGIWKVVNIHFWEYLEESKTQGCGPPWNITSFEDPTATSATSSGSTGWNVCTGLSITARGVTRLWSFPGWGVGKGEGGGGIYPSLEQGNGTPFNPGQDQDRGIPPPPHTLDRTRIGVVIFFNIKNILIAGRYLWMYLTFSGL